MKKGSHYKMSELIGIYIRIKNKPGDMPGSIETFDSLANTRQL